VELIGKRCRHDVAGVKVVSWDDATTIDSSFLVWSGLALTISRSPVPNLREIINATLPADSLTCKRLPERDANCVWANDPEHLRADNQRRRQKIAIVHFFTCLVIDGMPVPC